jgi:HD-like signal output (HDOD) protein
LQKKAEEFSFPTGTQKRKTHERIMTDRPNHNPGKKRIGELLVENGYVTARQVNEALEIQKRKHDRIANILIDLGYLNETDFLEFLGTIPGSASIELSACEIEPEIIDLIPRELARNLEVIPIGRLGNSLTVAMVCPLDEAGQQQLADETGLKVRPVLCSRGAVYKALDRYYRQEEPVPCPTPASDKDISDLDNMLKLRRIAKLIEEIGEIPTLPTIMQTITDIVNDPDSSAADLANVIGSDVGLSSKILKLANSAAFGFSREISDVQHAIALLGFRQTQALALSVPVFENLIKLASFDFRSFWGHSLRCARLSRLLSTALPERSIDSAFVAGLLHDIGQVVFAMSVSGKQAEAARLQTSRHMSPIEAEEAVLGTTHAEIGYHLGEHWLLPPALTTAVRYHHSPELQPQPQDVAGIVFLANTYCEMPTAQLRETEQLDDKVRQVLAGLNISEPIFLETLGSFADTDRTPDIDLF